MLKTNTSQTINVLAVVTAMGAGGLETYLVNVLRAIDRNRFRFKIAYTGRHESWFDEELEAMGVETIACPNPYTQVSYIRRMYRLLKTHRIDAVCDFRSDFAGPTLMAAKMAGVPRRIAQYRSTSPLFEPTPMKNVYVRLMHYLTGKYADTIVGNSASVLDAFYPEWKADCRKFTVINNGVQLDRFRRDRDECGKKIRETFNIPPETLIVGHVGRFNVAKNHPVILKSFARLREKYPDVHLLLVGDGEQRESIESLADQLNIRPFMTFAGQVKDVPLYLNAMDIFFFPSIYEGQPNGLIEAMVAALPVVASNINEIRETVPEALSGNLLAPEDVEGFSEVLLALAKDSAKREKESRTVSQHAGDCFSLTRSVEKFTELLI